MKTVQKKPAEVFRMSADEFDRMMGQALQVKPEAASPKKKAKKAAPKKAAKK